MCVCVCVFVFFSGLGSYQRRGKQGGRGLRPLKSSREREGHAPCSACHKTSEDQDKTEHVHGWATKNCETQSGASADGQRSNIEQRANAEQQKSSDIPSARLRVRGGTRGNKREGQSRRNQERAPKR